MKFKTNAYPKKSFNVLDYNTYALISLVFCIAALVPSIFSYFVSWYRFQFVYNEIPYDLDLSLWGITISIGSNTTYQNWRTANVGVWYQVYIIALALLITATVAITVQIILLFLSCLYYLKWWTIVFAIIGVISSIGSPLIFLRHPSALSDEFYYYFKFNCQWQFCSVFLGSTWGPNTGWYLVAASFPFNLVALILLFFLKSPLNYYEVLEEDKKKKETVSGAD